MVIDDRHWDFFVQTLSMSRVEIGRRTSRVSPLAYASQVLACLGIVLLTFFGTAGCSTSRPQTPPSQTPLISIELMQLPPATLPVGTQAQVSASVTSDPANAGVDWIATCGSISSCGSFFPAHTDNGAATTFTAPTAVPAHSTISVTALSSTDRSKAATSTVTVFSYVTSVTITQLPPIKAPAGSTITLAAAVVGDPANLGVDWTATCAGINCTSSFTSTHSIAGSTTTFRIPDPSQSGSIPIVGATVVITAYATADHTCANRLPPTTPPPVPPSCSATTNFQVSAPPLITITQPPPASMLTNASANVVAVVQNDATNAGVDWQVSCANAPCGTVVPSHTASGASAVFTAPPDVPSATSPQVTIAAIATASPTAHYEVVVTIIVPISVKITQVVPNGTIVQGRSAPLIASVSNDPSNAGIDWSCAPAGSCGVFSATHTASGSSTTYTAPSNPANVTITATSTADHTTNDFQAITVIASSPPSSLLSGTFVMLLNSKHSQNGPYMLGGLITGQSNGGTDQNGGGINNAAFHLVDASGNSGNSVGIFPTSTYSIGPDGRGLIQLLVNTGGLPGRPFGVTGATSPCGSTANCGSLTLSVVFVTPQHAILSESDSFGTASGTLDLQNLQGFSAISPGVYSLSLSGAEKASPYADYFVASAVTIPSSTSYSYISDSSDAGVILSAPFATVPQGFANGGFNGQNLTLSFVNLGLPTQFNLNLWPIDATHFVVTDILDSFFGTPPVILSGYFTQQSSTPTVSGTYAFTQMGASIAAAQPQAAGGILTCSSSGTLDVVPLNGTVLTNQPITANCGAVTNGRSLIGLAGAASAGINQFAAYPTLDQGLYLIELDGGANGSSGAGVALQQTLAPPIASTALTGNYATHLHANTVLGAQGFVGQIVADGVSTLTGTGDINSFDATAAPGTGTPSLGAAFNGLYSPSNDGRFPITLTITPAGGQSPPQITNQNLACYLVDANTCMLLGLDATAPGTGVLLLQNTGL